LRKERRPTDHRKNYLIFKVKSKGRKLQNCWIFWIWNFLILHVYVWICKVSHLKCKLLLAFPLEAEEHQTGVGGADKAQAGVGGADRTHAGASEVEPGADGAQPGADGANIAQAGVVGAQPGEDGAQPGADRSYTGASEAETGADEALGSALTYLNPPIPKLSHSPSPRQPFSVDPYRKWRHKV
jgi:hypothetical protein